MCCWGVAAGVDVDKLPGLQMLDCVGMMAALREVTATSGTQPLKASQPFDLGLLSPAG